jgi:hypothetical protein
MQESERYLTSTLVFLTVSLVLFSAVPLIEAGKLFLVGVVVVLSGVVAIVIYLYSKGLPE